MISLRKIIVKSANGKILVREASMELEPKKVIGVYGPNGSGKTSFLKAIAWKNQNLNISGESWIDGNPIFLSSTSASIKAKKILYLGSDFQSAFQVSVRELMELAKNANPDSIESIAEIIERFDISSLINRIFDEMSDGEKQRVMIARGVLQSPKWLILDETFSKIDLDHSFHLVSSLRESIKKGMGIIIASHDLNLLSELSDELWFIKDGKITTSGTVEQVLTSENLNELYPNRMVHVVRSPDNGKKKVIY